MKKIFLLVICFILTSCASRSRHIDKPVLISLQFVDRNGFSETISTKERLDQYSRSNFLEPQPFQKVVRLFERNKEGKSASAVTSYHENGQIWQYLEVVNGRAHGHYQEWHPSGQLKITAQIIEGLGDLSLECIDTWVFDKESLVFDEQGYLSAQFSYDKGELSGPCFYYYPNGFVKQKMIYIKNQEEGEVFYYDEKGLELGKTNYLHGIKEGLSICYGNGSRSKFEENYKQGLLRSALYYNPEGEVVSQVIDGDGLETVFKERSLLAQYEYKEGKREGKVYFYYLEGGLKNEYSTKDGENHGEEWLYYPQEKNKPEEKKPKAYFTWYEGKLQGIVKTWYKVGVIESEREFYNNKKNGPSFAWYKNGQLMFLEEYENDSLVKAIYRKKGEKEDVSSIEKGEGIATLYDGDGIFLKKISYYKGSPIEK